MFSPGRRRTTSTNVQPPSPSTGGGHGMGMMSREGSAVLVHGAEGEEDDLTDFELEKLIEDIVASDSSAATKAKGAAAGKPLSRRAAGKEESTSKVLQEEAEAAGDSTATTTTGMSEVESRRWEKAMIAFELERRSLVRSTATLGSNQSIVGSPQAAHSQRSSSAAGSSRAPNPSPLHEQIHHNPYTSAKMILGGGASQADAEGIDSVVDDFVKNFLAQSNAVAGLHEQLSICDTNLRTMERSLHSFAQNIGAVKSEIGMLRDRAKTVATSLGNTKATEKIFSDTLQGLIIPPEVIRMILMTDDTEIGPQCSLAIRKLYEVLVFRYRHSGTLVASAASMLRPSSASSLSTLRRAHLEGGSSSSLAELHPSCSSSVRDPAEASETASEAESSAPSSSAYLYGQHHFGGGLSEWEDLSSTAAFRELTPVVEQLTLLTLQKIRNFLFSKFELLRKPRTNIGIQQHNVLRGYRHLAFFMKQTPQLLSCRGSAIGGGGHGTHASVVARAFYDEVRRSYSTILSQLYHDKLKGYITQCNQLEVTGGEGSVQPTLTSTSPHVTPEQFNLGSRIRVFEDLRAAPIIPHISAGLKRKHNYIETFRSINVLLTDIVTSEFLFTFEFFAGDTTVYVDVFRETIQMVVDYVAEVLLSIKASSHQTPPRGRESSVSGTAGGNSEKWSWLSKLNKNCSVLDYNGLLILIRIIHTFKVEMQRKRKLYCLDSYFDSVLLLLWPAFDAALEIQLNSLRELSGSQLLVLYSNTRQNSMLDRMRQLHPLVARLTALTTSIITLSSGTVPTAELRSSAVLISPLAARRGSQVQPLGGAGVPSPSHGTSADQQNLAGTPPQALREKTAGGVSPKPSSPLPNPQPHHTTGGHHYYHPPAVEGALVAMVDMDYAESTERFAVLQSKLSVYALETQRLVERLMQVLSQQNLIVPSPSSSPGVRRGGGGGASSSSGMFPSTPPPQPTTPAAPTQPQRSLDRLLPLWSAIPVNHYYYVARQWTQAPSPKASVPFDEGRLSAWDRQLSPDEGNFSHPLEADERQSTTTSSNIEGESVVGEGHTSPAHSARLTTSMLGAGFGASSEHSPETPDSSTAASPFLEPLEAIAFTCCGEDLSRLTQMLDRSRQTFVRELLQSLIPELLQEGESATAAAAPGTSFPPTSNSSSSPATLGMEKLKAQVKRFAENWKDDLQLAVKAVTMYISDPSNALHTIKTLFSQILLLNTKLQATLTLAVAQEKREEEEQRSLSARGQEEEQQVGTGGGGTSTGRIVVVQQAGGVDRVLRTLVVSNQQLLHHMKALYAAEQKAVQYW